MTYPNSQTLECSGCRRKLHLDTALLGGFVCCADCGTVAPVEVPIPACVRLGDQDDRGVRAPDPDTELRGYRDARPSRALGELEISWPHPVVHPRPNSPKSAPRRARVRRRLELNQRA